MALLKLAGLVFVPMLLLADIGDTINAVIATCTNKQACYVTLQPGAEYSFATTITIPDQFVDLDCRGAKLTYTGAGKAISVLSSPSGALGNTNLTGRIHDCYILGNASADSAAIWQESRFGMVYDHLRIRNFTGTNGIGIKFENKTEAAGFPTTNEQNTVTKCDFVNNRYGMSVHRTTGDSSFRYNQFNDLHFNLTDGQTGIIFIGSGGADSLDVVGGYYSAKFTINYVATAATAVSLTDGTDWQGTTVQFNGQQDAGPTPSSSLHVDSSSVFANWGYYEMAGTARTGIGVMFLYPQGFRSNPANVVLGPPLTYTMDVNGFTRFQQEIVLGSGSGGAHFNMDAVNSDTSFIVTIPSGGTDSNTFNFIHAYSQTPTCTISTNTFISKRVYINAGIVPVGFSFTADSNGVLNVPYTFALTPLVCSGATAGPGGTPCGYIDVPNYPVAVFDGSSFKASLDYPASADTVVFVHCIGNKN